MDMPNQTQRTSYVETELHHRSIPQWALVLPECLLSCSSDPEGETAVAGLPKLILHSSLLPLLHLL